MNFTKWKKIVVNNVQLLIFNTLIIIFSNLSIAYIITSMYIEKVAMNIENNVKEYEEVDIEHICSLIKCIYINYNNTTYKSILYNNYEILQETNDDYINLIKISQHGYLTENFQIKISLSHIDGWQDGWIVVDYSVLYELLKNYILSIILIIILLNIGLLISSINYYNKQLLLDVHSIKAETYSNNVVILTENIHHELNTPLAVISNKILKLEKHFQEVKSPSCTISRMDENHILDTTQDFNLINSSINQMLDVLNVMKQFKGYKKDDKRSVYEIIETTANILTVVQPEKFDYNIDESLKEYYLNQEYLTTGELTSVILNMCKNSIEADSTHIKFINYENTGLYIIDNGNGIDLEFINRIYDEDFTTKNSKYKGNGLYINKSTLIRGSGNIELIKSNKEGTIFKLTMKNFIAEKR